MLEKVPDKDLSAVGSSQSNLLAGWRSRQLYVLTSLVKINSQVKRRQGLVDNSCCGKGRSCYLATHLDGRHKAPGFSLAVELFVYFPGPSQGKALCSETRSSGGWFHICLKDGCAVNAVLGSQAAFSLGPFGFLHCPLRKGPVLEVCAYLPSGFWQTSFLLLFFFF